MQKILLIGGGGHAKVLIELIRATKSYKIVGILDPGFKVGFRILNVPVLGGDDLLSETKIKKIRNICIAVGSTKDNSRRRLIFKKIKRDGYCLPTFVHPTAIVSPSAKIALGVQIMAGCIIQTDASIGENALVNTGAILEHDVRIGDHAHIASGAVIAGAARIGKAAFIGCGARIIQGLRVGPQAVVGAGAVVVSDVPAKTTYAGIPAKQV